MMCQQIWSSNKLKINDHKTNTSHIRCESRVWAATRAKPSKSDLWSRKDTVGLEFENSCLEFNTVGTRILDLRYPTKFETLRYRFPDLGSYFEVLVRLAAHTRALNIIHGVSCELSRCVMLTLFLVRFRSI